MERLRASGITLALLSALLLAACGDGAKQSSAAPAAPPPTVKVIRVAPHDLPVEAEFAGRTAGSREVEVRARVRGILLERTYTEGTRVEPGKVLFRIDSRPYEIALQRAKARLQEAQARLAAAERDWNRAEALYKKQVASERTRDDALSALELAKANIAIAQAEVDAARVDLDYTSVEAPIAGITGREVVSQGSLVGTTAENSLLTRITRLDPIYVNFAIPDAEWLRQRQLIESGRLISTTGKRLLAELRLADGRAYRHEGHVNFTDTTVDRDTGTIQARAVFPNPGGDILPGQFVRIMLKGLVRSDAIVVPEAAVMQGPKGTFVYRLTEDNKAEVASVKTGPTVKAGWIIEEGLKPGDRIVVEGVIRVRPGQPVRPAEPSPQSTAAAGYVGDGRQIDEAVR